MKTPCHYFFSTSIAAGASTLHCGTHGVPLVPLTSPTEEQRCWVGKLEDRIESIENKLDQIMRGGDAT